MRGPNTVGLGAGLGVGLGIPLLLGCIALGFYVGRHRRKSTRLRGREKTDVPVGRPGGAGPRQEMDNDRGIHEADSSLPRYTPYGPGQAPRGVGSEDVITTISRGELPT
jgi:hypothetical protein